MALTVYNDKIEIDRNGFRYYFDANRNNNKHGVGACTILEALKDDIKEDSIDYYEYQSVVLELLKGGHI